MNIKGTKTFVSDLVQSVLLRPPLQRSFVSCQKESWEHQENRKSAQCCVILIKSTRDIFRYALVNLLYDHHHHHNYHHDYHHDYHHHCHDHFHHLTLIFAAVKFTWLRLNESSKQTQLSLHKCLTRRNKSAISNNSLKQTHVRPSLLWKMRAT